MSQWQSCVLAPTAVLTLLCPRRDGRWFSLGASFPGPWIGCGFSGLPDHLGLPDVLQLMFSRPQFSIQPFPGTREDSELLKAWCPLLLWPLLNHNLPDSQAQVFLLTAHRPELPLPLWVLVCFKLAILPHLNKNVVPLLREKSRLTIGWVVICVHHLRPTQRPEHHHDSSFSHVPHSPTLWGPEESIS